MLLNGLRAVRDELLLNGSPAQGTSAVERIADGKGRVLLSGLRAQGRRARGAGGCEGGPRLADPMQGIHAGERERRAAEWNTAERNAAERNVGALPPGAPRLRVA